MTLLLVPPDTRPPTLAFPRNLALAVGLNVLVPPPDALNTINEPGDTQVLREWLLDNASDTSLLIASLETLTLGGMIPARRVNTSLEEVRRRLETLRELKEVNPELRILAHGVIVRVAHDNDPLEEKPYYGVWGDELRRYSELSDRGSRGEDVSLETGELPEEILEDWLTTRRRNHQLHLDALDLVAEEVLEHLCLTLDDTSTYGLAAQDRRALEAKTDDLGLWSQVDIYPGADEVPATLLARALNPEPLRVAVCYPGVKSSLAEMRYEDRCLGELVKAHVRAAHAVEVERTEDADLILAVNAPALKQGETQPDYATVDTAERHLPLFVERVKEWLGQSVPVTLADVAYANGAEARLMELLAAQVRLSDLSGFSAWNTAGNSLGGALAQGLLAHRIENQEKWLGLRFNRFVDDYLYQTLVRAEVHAALPNPNPFDLGEQVEQAERVMDERIRPLAETLWAEHFADDLHDLIWHPARLAWARLFTGVFEFQVKTKG